MNPSKYFSICGQPCDDSRVNEIKANLHIDLPTTYRSIIKACGAGYLSEVASYIAPPDTVGCRVTLLYGNGVHPNGRMSFNLDTNALETAQTWGLPDWGILIGEGEAEHRTPLMINVAHPRLEKNAIYCLDKDSESIVKIATNFDELWSKITQLEG